MRDPPVFLFDEPLSNLDVKLRVQTRAEIIELHRQIDATMVYVTHDQTEAMTMGDRIAALKNGGFSRWVRRSPSIDPAIVSWPLHRQPQHEFL